MVNPTKLVSLIRRLRNRVVLRQLKFHVYLVQYTWQQYASVHDMIFCVANQTVCDFVTTVTMKFQWIPYMVVGKTLLVYQSVMIFSIKFCIYMVL
jgi:hypothetical protein